MNASPKSEAFHPPNPLAEKAPLRPGASLKALYESAEQSVEAIRGDVVAALDTEAAALKHACDQDPSDGGWTSSDRERIATSATILRELAGSVGYPLISDIATSLYVLVTGPAAAEPQFIRVVRLHVDAIEVVLRDDVRLDGGATGAALVASLREAVDRFAAGK